jgi:hypothetical protein
MAEMTTQDIVKTEIERTSPGTDWRVVYAQIHNMVKNPKHRIFRANNSLFIITNNGDETVNVTMCNADTLQDMPKSIQEFGAALKKCGFTEANFATTRPAMLRMLGRAGYKVQILPSTTAQGTRAKVVL